MVLGVIDCYTQPATNRCKNNVHKHNLDRNLLFPRFIWVDSFEDFPWKAQSGWKWTKPESEQYEAFSGTLVAARQGAGLPFDSAICCNQE